MFKLLLLLLLSTGAKAQTVYKTPSGAKYHLASCRMVNNVSTEISVADAVAQGLGPCKICRPPVVGGAATGKQKGVTNTVQCKGMTKKGTRCKHMTSIANGYCFQHNPDN